MKKMYDYLNNLYYFSFLFSLKFKLQIHTNSFSLPVWGGSF